MQLINAIVLVKKLQKAMHRAHWSTITKVRFIVERSDSTSKQYEFDRVHTTEDNTMVTVYLKEK
jgi:hypothetical protein